MVMGDEKSVLAKKRFWLYLARMVVPRVGCLSIPLAPVSTP